MADKISGWVECGGVIFCSISGIPAGASLNQGTLNQDGSYTLSPSDLSGLTITLASHASADFDLTVTATSHDDHRSEERRVRKDRGELAPEAQSHTEADELS